VGSNFLASWVDRAETSRMSHVSILPRIHVTRQNLTSEAQRGIILTVHNDTTVLGAVLGPSTNMRLHNVTSIEERHFSVGLDPQLSKKSADV
jgi:hypothetical protein